MINLFNKTFVLFLLLLFHANHSYCQNSYLRELSGLEGLGFFHPFLGNGQNGDLSIVMKSGRGFALLEVSPEGNVNNAIQIATTDLNVGWLPHKYDRNGAYHMIGCQKLLGGGEGSKAYSIFMVNSETGEKWAKKNYGIGTIIAPASILQSGKIIMPHYLEAENLLDFNSLGLSLLDLTTGDEIWSYYYRPDLIGSGFFFVPLSIEEFPNGDFSVLTQMSFSQPIPSAYYSLTRMSIDGTVNSSVVLEGSERLKLLDQSIDGNGNVYLSGFIYSDELGYREGVIAKMDKNFHLLWAKKLTAEAFPFVVLKLKSFPNGEVIFTYVTEGDLPVITGKISPEGELLWHRGYSFYYPEVTIGQDSSIYFSSPKKYYEDGTWEYSPIVAKTNSDGIIEGCEQFDACLELVDIDLVFTEETWNRFDAPSLPSFEVTMEPTSFSTTPHCGTPAPPRADFSFPDTLCQYSCASPTDLKNRLANRVEWTIQGPGVDTSIIDSTFYWCFDSSGVYTIEQEIWLLGCSEFFSHTLEVLPDNLQVSLGEDRIICKEAPYQLMPEGSRALQTFFWDDESEDETLTVLQSGDYSLLATDGYCRNSDTVTLTFIDDLIDEAPLILPPNERTCPAFLPYLLQPTSAYNTSFYLNNEWQDSVFNLTDAGIYTISVEVESCLFSKQFTLEIEDCNIPIYFGNSFSPNDDGINDLFFPQGQDFEGHKLQIFDRWGGLLYQTKEAPFAWDGTFHGKPLNTGVYIMTFTYFNRLNLEEEVVSGEVLLLR